MVLFNIFISPAFAPCFCLSAVLGTSGSTFIEVAIALQCLKRLSKLSSLDQMSSRTVTKHRASLWALTKLHFVDCKLMESGLVNRRMYCVTTAATINWNDYIACR